MQPYIKGPIINQDTDRNVTQERIRREAEVILTIKETYSNMRLGNYPRFRTLSSQKSSVTFVLRKVKAKVSWGTLKKGNICPAIKVPPPLTPGS